jgi:hypothetical protein
MDLIIGEGQTPQRVDPYTIRTHEAIRNIYNKRRKKFLVVIISIENAQKASRQRGAGEKPFATKLYNIGIAWVACVVYIIASAVLSPWPQISCNHRIGEPMEKPLQKENNQGTTA